ncbi:MAG: GIY-YIG nuclease family protein [Lewinellaceae bacterium]|nr:GIY-YIG nuclease family protein [Lewinellaceae bacterium]
MQEVTGSNPVSSTKVLHFESVGLFLCTACFELRFYTLTSTGSCQDLNRRLTEHNTGRSTYTKTGAPWDLKWQSTFETRSLAVKEERRIKAKKSRKFIEYLIHGQAG